MYGLTEAFRATYLRPEEVDRRPGLDRQGDPERRDPGPARGRHAVRARTSRANWCSAARSSEWATGTIPRRRPSATSRCQAAKRAWCGPEIAVFSGDTVRADEEGFLYFIGRRDEMIKTSGYRVSPTEVEEVVYATQRVGECAAFGVDHPALGQAIVLVVDAARMVRMLDEAALLADCRSRCRPTWCRRRSTCARARCRATRTARSTASCCRPNSSNSFRQTATMNARSHAALEGIRGHRRRTAGRRHAADAAWPRGSGERPSMPMTAVLLSARVRSLREHFRPKCSLHYAIKANPMPALVGFMAAPGRRAGCRLRRASCGSRSTRGMDPMRDQFCGARQDRRRNSRRRSPPAS